MVSAHLGQLCAYIGHYLPTRNKKAAQLLETGRTRPDSFFYQWYSGSTTRNVNDVRTQISRQCTQRLTSSKWSHFLTTIAFADPMYGAAMDLTKIDFDLQQRSIRLFLNLRLTYIEHDNGIAAFRFPSRNAASGTYTQANKR